MRSASLLRVILAVLTTVPFNGCKPGIETPKIETPPPAPTLVAARAVMRIPEGEVVVFDDKSGPELCFQSLLPAQPRIEWRSDQDHTTVLHCTKAQGQAKCLRCRGADVPLGSGGLLVDGRPLELEPRTAWRPTPNAHAPVRKAAPLIKAGRTKEAFAELEGGIRTSRGWARVWSAVHAFFLRHETEGSIAAIDQAILAAETAEQEGITSEASKRYRAAAHLSFEVRRFAEAAALLTRAEALVPDLGKERARLTYENGALALHLERFREAEPFLRKAVNQASAAGQYRDMFRFSTALALTYGQLGRFEDALKVLDELKPTEAIPLAHRAEHQTNLADVKSRAMLSGALRMQPEAVDRHLERAETLFQQDSQPARAIARRIELAWWTARTARIARAKTILDALGRPPTVGQTRWMIPLARATIHLAEGQPADADRILADAEEGIRRERKQEPSELAANAAALRGRCARAVGNPAAAAVHFERALSEVERLSQRALLRRSAGGLLERMSTHRAEAVEALVHAGHVERAMARADRTRTLLLRRLRDLKAPQDRARWEALDQRRTSLIERLRTGCVADRDRAQCQKTLERDLDRWGREATALFEDPPSDAEHSAARMENWLQRGEGLITLEPLGPKDAHHWRWFHLERGRVTTGTTADRAGPWLRRAETHDHLYVVADAVDDVNAIIDAFAPDRGPSITSIPAGSWLTWKATPADGLPLIVVGSTSELASTAREGEWLAARWPEATYMKTTALRRDVLTQRLQQARRLHFAGHGRLAGSDPWDTFVDLGPAGALTLEDIILHRPRFSLAVLNGCDTGTTERAYEIGLPQALMVTGTRTVVATVRPVLDAAALRFIKAFYTNGGAERPARAFRTAVDAFRRADDPTWRDFRIWGHR